MSQLFYLKHIYKIISITTLLIYVCIELIYFEIVKVSLNFVLGAYGEFKQASLFG